MKYMLYAAAIVLPLGLTAPTQSRADSCTGIDTLVTDVNQTTDIGGGLKKIVWTAQSVVTSNNSVYKLVVGECSSVTLVTPDGKSQVSGYCVRHDKDGDTASISTTQAPGADKIQWKVTSGTGKYAGKQDSGWAQPMMADGKIVVIKWGGDCH